MNKVRKSYRFSLRTVQQLLDLARWEQAESETHIIEILAEQAHYEWRKGKMTSKKLQAMAREAKENWMIEEPETAAGLDALINDEAQRQAVLGSVADFEDWNGLEEVARFVGAARHVSS